MRGTDNHRVQLEAGAAPQGCYHSGTLQDTRENAEPFAPHETRDKVIADVKAKSKCRNQLPQWPGYHMASRADDSYAIGTCAVP